MTPNVLVVDDNKDNRKLLCLTLEGFDYEIFQAASVADAAVLIAQKDFDLALLDIGLPDGSGLALAQQARTRFPSAIVIVISAIDGRAELEIAQDSGVNVFVVKPFNVPQLLNLIHDIATGSINAKTKLFVVKAAGK